MKVIIDLETDSLDPKSIWVAVCREVDTDKVSVFKNLDSDKAEIERFKSYAKTVTLWVAHNGMDFDIPVLVRFGLVPRVSILRTLDTLVVSRLLDYNLEGGHSLEAWGQRLKFPKTFFKDFSQLSQEMIDYCIQDTLVTKKLYQKFLPYINSSKWQGPIRLEHDLAIICKDMQTQGFYFDIDSANKLKDSLVAEKDAIEAEFQVLFPPRLLPIKTVQYRIKKDGEETESVKRQRELFPMVQVDGDKLVCYNYISFDPASPKDRIDRMWEAGWVPFEKTKGHIQHLRAGTKRDKTKDDKFNRYGWVMSEANLNTLPPEAPEGARMLAKWVTLQGRLLILQQWLEAYNAETHRIHGRFNHIGSWTGRMSHVNPNSANIFSPFHGVAKSPVEEVKKAYDYSLRACWSVPSGKVLVGTDAAGIQLRVLAHTIRNKAYSDAIIFGVKENETDIHNVNKKALGLSHLTRDDAKTFIYAWLLGAGIGKVAQILRCKPDEAEIAMDNFMQSIDGLYELKKELIPRYARAGGFFGIDGRFVKCDSSHLMLAGILQNGEKVAMAAWTVQWRQMAKAAGLDFKHVNFVHDEVQVEVNSMEDAEKLKDIQKKAMSFVNEKYNIFCPFDVETNIGYNWSESH